MSVEISKMKVSERSTSNKNKNKCNNKLKVINKYMDEVRRKCGFMNGIDVDFDGKGGGLSLGWHNEVTASLRSYFRRHIDVLIDEDTKDKT